MHHTAAKYRPMPNPAPQGLASYCGSNNLAMQAPMQAGQPQGLPLHTSCKSLHPENPGSDVLTAIFLIFFIFPPPPNPEKLEPPPPPPPIRICTKTINRTPHTHAEHAACGGILLQHHGKLTHPKNGKVTHSHFCVYAFLLPFLKNGNCKLIFFLNLPNFGGFMPSTNVESLKLGGIMLSTSVETSKLGGIMLSTSVETSKLSGFTLSTSVETPKLGGIMLSTSIETLKLIGFMVSTSVETPKICFLTKKENQNDQN
ncbi:hypothetical protein R83H12_01532 [Fibrobacteria bacterium R8-3-H12]